ncbi:4Fe-4S dicluster domain-containing protein [Muricoccus nepalensis]|uniref:4Fe-4S dicluster domain-containing protein n=1 Tax=Muricoccus nepalensis TaxID=1854500 RepID=UPI001F4FB4EC|nr:4Fe-4S dicluster domain-containing protein [Roseomonas nepalensis]
MSAPPLTRRQAALALIASAASLASCDRPEEEIVPYVEQPERVVPGVPLRFATALPLDGYARGVIATVHEGRPVKLEGNPAHPGSGGATDVFLEAELLALYDPDRSRAVREGTRIASWEGFLSAFLPPMRAASARGGEGLSLLTGHVTSPTLLRLIDELRARYPRLRWHAHQAVGEANALAGAALAFGRPLLALPRLDRAAVVLAIDADPLGPGPDGIRHGREFAARRAARREGGGFSRLYAAEPAMTQTGAKADHRLALPPAALGDLAAHLAARLGAPLSPPALPPAAARFLDAALADLRAHPGEALVVTGEWQPPEVHALVHWINERLGGAPAFVEPPGAAGDGPAGIGELAGDLRAGRVETLLVLGANPAYDAPGELDLAGALRGSQAFTVHLGAWRDETAALCRWHLPEHHPLEDWGDLRARDGTVSLCQPLIRPLYGTRSAAWLLGVALGRLDDTSHGALRATWSARQEGDFEAWWRRALHDGVVAGSAAPAVPPPPARLPSLPERVAGDGLALALRPDPTLWDGRYANNAWLQECPKPLTRLVWGNAALMAPEDAAARGIGDGEMIRLELAGRSLEVPALLAPGTAPGAVVLALGHGRRRAGAIGDGVGADAYALRRAGAPWSAEGLAAVRLGRPGGLLREQPGQRLEGEAKELFQTLSLDGFSARRSDPPPAPSRPPSLNPDAARDTYAWGMVIDTTLCIGCNACVVACQSENNVPVVGPEQVAGGRDMHWLRIDTYDLGTPEAPSPGFQPVPCMHCEHAPCEPVCPVAASVHDAEGLNVQVYNRCIGTRFCQANCPYKVRRFNWYGYADGQEYANQGAPVLAAQRNPEVTVRARGVMEKCTYCTQRISAARRAAEREGRPIRDGEVVTACQAACPSGAIVFGDIGDPASAAARLRQEPQHYALLGHLGTRPRTTYLAEVSNPNPALDDGAA